MLMKEMEGNQELVLYPGAPLIQLLASYLLGLSAMPLKVAA